ncbi:MAG: hypothetical protein SFU85_11105 [Candidatus Methylacidiphilales bacterium]|nr:hypothetical protein [Candidatus Methylacidiphilales bacterium]
MPNSRAEGRRIGRQIREYHCMVDLLGVNQETGRGMLAAQPFPGSVIQALFPTEHES